MTTSIRACMRCAYRQGTLLLHQTCELGAHTCDVRANTTDIEALVRQQARHRTPVLPPAHKYLVDRACVSNRARVTHARTHACAIAGVQHATNIRATIVVTGISESRLESRSRCRVSRSMICSCSETSSARLDETAAHGKVGRVYAPMHASPHAHSCPSPYPYLVLLYCEPGLCPSRWRYSTFGWGQDLRMALGSSLHTGARIRRNNLGSRTNNCIERT